MRELKLDQLPKFYDSLRKSGAVYDGISGAIRFKLSQNEMEIWGAMNVEADVVAVFYVGSGKWSADALGKIRTVPEKTDVIDAAISDAQSGN